MDIDGFIAKYRPEWDRLEQATKSGSRGLRKLEGSEIQEIVRLYLRASAHLAEIRTRYHDRRLEAYLTGVVARAHSSIYSARTRTLARFFRLMGNRYREAIRETAPFIVISAVVLVLVTLLTLIWVTNSPEARAGLIPPQAREAIRRAGGTRADFGLSSASLSTIIFINNAKVAVFSFALGITLGVGTLYVLIVNGFVIGSLGAGFQVAGKAGLFWALVLPHGLLELTAICIAAGAGLRIGWSIIAPGDRFRARALAEESRAAVTVIAGVIPAFIVAALIEGFVTGSPIPSYVQLALGVVVCLLYVYVLFGRGGKTARSKAPVGFDSEILVGQPPGQFAGSPIYDTDSKGSEPGSG